MKHFLFYIPSFAGGGAERLSVLLANQFCEMGNKVSFAVNTADGPHKSLLAKDVSLHTLNPNSHLSSIFLFSSLLNNIKPDYIYCRSGVCPIIGVMGQLLTTTNIIVIIAYDNPYSPTTDFGSRLTRYLAALLSRLSYCTISVSSDIQTELRVRFKAPAKKLKVIFNPIDLEEVNSKCKKPFPLVLSEYKKEKPYIVAAGRLVRQKDYPTLIRAFHQIHQKIPHDLLILGQGPLEKDIRKLLQELSLEDRVVLPGYCQNLFPVFKAADLFVLSSIYEGFGIVIVESLAVGTPVVCTNCIGGPKEILENGKYGKLTPVGDDKALAQAITQTLKSPLSPEILKKRAADFSLKRIANQYLEIVEDIAQP